MFIIGLIFVGLPVLACVWWRWADRRLRCLARGRRWRIALAAFIGGNLGLYVWAVQSRFSGQGITMPSVLLGECYIWHLLIVPLAVAALTGATIIRAAVLGCTRLLRLAAGRAAPQPASRNGDNPDDPPTADAESIQPTRRQVLSAALAAVPVLATGVGQARAMSQLGTFRVRRLDVWLAALPPGLDGLTIVHMSDLHVGRFTNGPILEDVVRRTRTLHPDLVMFTGDLIDYALDDLPAGLNVLRRVAPAERLFLCEGNHDLFEGRTEFEERVRRAGLSLLINQAVVRHIRGHRVQVMGLRWGGFSGAVDHEMDRLLRLRDPGAFTIVLAHHPHAFDQAAAAGVPLTLAGHTHGGQIMLTRDIGAGSVLFKYCSGLYRRNASALVVSNGVGNWFPLRINAPAEILHLTLRRVRPETQALSTADGSPERPTKNQTKTRLL